MSSIADGLGYCDISEGLQSSGSCGVNRVLGSSSSLLSTLLLATSVARPAESFISFISLQSTYAWYMKLSQFETVFLSLIMLQICFLRYLEILPINVNNFFLSDPSGRRRKKRSFWKAKGFDCDRDVLISSLLKVLKKVDEGSCFTKTLCELESMSRHDYHSKRMPTGVPTETRKLLTALKVSSKYRIATQSHHNYYANDPHDAALNDNLSLSSSYCKALDGLEQYEEAVRLGSSTNYSNSTLCEDRYSACPLTAGDIEAYIGTLIDANFL